MTQGSGAAPTPLGYTSSNSVLNAFKTTGYLKTTARANTRLAGQPSRLSPLTSTVALGSHDRFHLQGSAPQSSCLHSQPPSHG